MNATRLRFGDFELDVAGYELSRYGRSIKLERIPMELLLLLVDRRGQLVTRDDILEKLWGKDVFLDVDNSINTAISKIRVALKDDPENPAFIKTISGKGYRFVASITVSPEDSGRVAGTGTPFSRVAAQPDGAPSVESASPEGSRSVRSGSMPQARLRSWWLWPSTTGLILAAALASWNWRGSLRRMVSPSPSLVIRSLAVLPLENLTGDVSQEYFADGMTDALITDLAQIGSLRVISRTSIMRYKGVRKPLPDIARELGVDGIVEGTVMHSGGRVRITSQLIYAPADQHLWARSYERELGDVVTLQGEIAQAIAEEVRVAVTPRERSHLAKRPTDSPEAYQIYLRGRYSWNQRTPLGTMKSIEFFQQATQKDPNFALAYAGLADAYNFSNVLGVVAPKDSSPQAKTAATKALLLDPELAEAHAALGMVKSHYDFDFPGAQQEFLKAIKLNPNYANAHLYYSGGYFTPMGRHEEAIAEVKKALELDPLSSAINNYMGNAYMFAGDYEKSFQQFQRTIELDPTFPLAHFFFAGLLSEMGRYEQAIEENQRGELLLGVSPERASAAAAEFRKALQTGGSNGYWQKNLEATLKEHKQAGTAYFASIELAGAYARVGDRENAFRWLEKSYQEKEGGSITLLRWEPDFKNLHTDPRFADLLGRMGLPH